jgi:hypothetical protein
MALSKEIGHLELDVDGDGNIYPTIFQRIFIIGGVTLSWFLVALVSAYFVNFLNPIHLLTLF